jgi:nickel/cobalt transporter (NicO) family protein
VNIELSLLLVTAASLGFVHTLLGPDHYVPFIAMAKARQWSYRKTFIITLLSGIGHVSSSVIIGLIGLMFGVEVLKLTKLESVRGNLAGWLLLGFGLAYTIWGVRRALKKRAPDNNAPHSHDGDPAHTHTHGLHTHIHADEKANITPWIIFTIFVFGPCEPLIPLIMYPAAHSSMWAVVLVALVFSMVTVSTMLTLVFLSLRGIERFSFKILERYSHALAGFVVLLCGVGIQFLGL